MTCGACGFENPERMSFCGACGQALAVATACPGCGSENPPGFKFCGECGATLGTARAAVARAPRDYTPKHLAEKILRSRSALEGERKLVTVLFADAKDSMELAGRLDAEEWHDILDRFFGILASSVHRFEGTVNQYTGDGIMALFGAPIAHEDHAQRACYAALHLREALAVFANELRLSHAIDFAVRVGIHTGEVVVGKIGDDLRMDYTAQGLTVGLAQRLEQMAAAGSTYLSDATAQLVSGYVELRDLGDATAKGVADPVRIFEVLGPGRHRTRLDVARSRGLTRFVGRDADLRTLEAALEQARAGDGQVVGVVAEAGVGKSRLCLEFVERCRARGIGVNQGRCPPHGKTVPYLPLLELLRDIFGIAEGDSDTEGRKKIASTLLALDAGLRDLLPLVFDFLGVPDPAHPAPKLGSELRQRLLVAFVRQLVRGRGEREARVLLIDDAHWIDAGSDAFLAQIVEAVPGTRTLVLVNFRPEYHAGWIGRSHYRQLPLLSLGPAATEELLADLVGPDPSLSGLAERIHERTRGNPFFIEEVVLSLVERGCLEGTRGAYRLVAPVAELEIPESVQAVLAARIDRLPEREKLLLQTASVVGKDVPESVLERVAGLTEAERATSLAALVAGEFLIETVHFPQPECAFKHPLTQEVAYASQLASRRARTHASVARAIQELYPDTLDEQASLVAYHFEQAGELLMAARWSIRAARSTATNDPYGAIRHWTAARSLLAKTDESDDRARLELESCRGLLAQGAWFGTREEEVAAIFASGTALAESRGDQEALCDLNLHYAIWHGMVRNDSVAFARHAQQAADLAELVGDAGAALAAASALALVAYMEGRMTEAIALGRRALPKQPDDLMLGSEYWMPPPVIWLQGFTRFLEGWAGRPAESLASLERLVLLARVQDAAKLSESLLSMWAVHQAELLGNAEVAMAHAARMLDVAQSLGMDLRFPGFHYTLGVAHLVAGNSDEGVDYLEQALAIHQEAGGGPPVELLTLSGRLAASYADMGQSARARETSARGLALVRALRMPVFVALALIWHAQVLRKTQGAEAREPIDAALAEAEALVESTGIRGWQPFLHVERAELARLLRDRAARERELREAHRLFTEMGAVGHVARLASIHD